MVTFALEWSVFVFFVSTVSGGSGMHRKVAGMVVQTNIDIDFKYNNERLYNQYIAIAEFGHPIPCQSTVQTITRLIAFQQHEIL